MALNDSLTPVEKSKLAVWDYPVSDKFTKVDKKKRHIVKDGYKYRILALDQHANCWTSSYY